MSSVLVSLDALGQDIREKIAAADSRVGTTACMLTEAARLLLEVKVRISATRETTFKAFLEQHSIGRSRAFELLAVAQGRKSIVGLRAANAKRQARHRETCRAARESVSNGRGIQGDDVAELKAEIDTLRKKLAEADDIMSKSVSDGFAAADALIEAWKSADKTVREDFLRSIRHEVGDWYVPKDWFHDVAFELHMARGTPIPEALARSRWYQFNPPRIDLLQA